MKEQFLSSLSWGKVIILSRVCQHLIRNCDKTRLRKKAGLPEHEEGGEEGEEAAKEWTQARNLDEGGAEVEVGVEEDEEGDGRGEKVEAGEKEGEVEREVETREQDS